MSIFNDKTNKNVADAAAKIMQQMAEGTKPKTEKEKDLAALGHPKDKITHKDVLIGRGVLKKEETEEVNESGPYDSLALRKLYSTDPKNTPDHLVKTQSGKEERAKRNVGSLKTVIKRGLKTQYDKKSNLPEEVELDEDLKGDMHPDAGKVLKHIQPQHHSVYKPFLKKGVYKGNYADRSAVLGAAEKAGHTVQEETEELDEGWKEMMADVKERERARGTGNFEKKKISTGTVYSRKPPKENEPAEPDQPKRGRGRPRKKFSEMIEIIADEGIRSLNEALELVEEPDNEQYTKEVERQKRKDAGTAPESEKAKVAKASVTAVQNEEYEELDEASWPEKEKPTKPTRPVRDADLRSPVGAPSPKYKPTKEDPLKKEEVDDIDEATAYAKRGLTQQDVGHDRKGDARNWLRRDDTSGRAGKDRRYHDVLRIGHGLESGGVKKAIQRRLGQGYNPNKQAHYTTKPNLPEEVDYEELDEGDQTVKTPELIHVAEGLAPGQAAWKKEMIAKGAVSFKRDQHGGGAVDRIVAYDKGGKVVGGFNRKGVAEAANWRREGMAKAVDRFTKEEYEELDERTLTEPEKAEKERLVKSLKKGLSGFKERYGERAKSVMYATATKRAKENK